MSDTVLRAVKFYQWYRRPDIFFRDVFKIEPFHYQKRVLQDITDFSKNRMCIMAGAGTGKTILIAGIALWYATVLPRILEANSRHSPIEVAVISGSFNQAQYLYNYARNAIEDNDYLRSLLKDETTIRRTEFKDRSVIYALPKSQQAIQGKHADLVIVDEASIVGDFVVMDTLRIVKATEYSRIILSGTPFVEKGDTCLFIEIYQNTERYPEWSRYHWTVEDCPLLSGRSDEARRMGDWYYEVFMMGRPLPKQSGMISIEKLRECSMNTPRYEYDDTGESPTMGVDWGFGRSATGIVVVQKVGEEYRVLYAKQFHSEDPDTISDTIENLASVYRVARIYCDAENKSENIRLEKKGLPVYPMHFRLSKTTWQYRLKSLVEQTRLRIPEDFLDLKWQLMRYDWDTKGNDDLVDALMLALVESGEDYTGDIGIVLGRFRSPRYTTLL